MQHKKLISFIAVLALSVTQLSIQAVFATSPHTYGSLVVTGADRGGVLVNGNSAISDTSILSGSSIETARDASASVAVPNIGRVEVGPNTLLTVSYDNSHATATLTRGCAVLNTPKGIAGSIVGADSKVLATNDVAAGGSISECLGTATSTDPEPQTGTTGGKPAKSDDGGVSNKTIALATVATIGAAVAIGLVVDNNDNGIRAINPSPF